MTHKQDYKEHIISLAKCTARFLRAKIGVTSVSGTVNIKAMSAPGGGRLAPHKPIRTNFRQLSSDLQSKWLTLSFGFAVHYVLLSLLGCNIVVEAVEKVLLVVHLLGAVTVRNRRQQRVRWSSEAFRGAASINSLLGYKTHKHTRFSKKPKQ